MATLVLTTVGGAIGGPIGAALGAVIGQSVDRAVLAPKGRQGPRLTELAVQTSSYGSQIPRLFGTMRVAGTVIWSTDLIESRSTAHAGKGQPTTTTYSYSASFAVLLSGRPVREVRRIWAEGKLLRGAAGDFKVSTGFRLHPGGEDQAADPLIAAAEGGLAPAHRGQAYAVFENLQLADYGNRIPSLTFEVVADAGAIAIGAIAAELGEGLVDGAVTLPVDGFAAAGDSVRGVLETLATASGAWFAADGARVRMLDGTGASVPVTDGGYAAGERPGAVRVRGVAALATVPGAVAVAHYDPARDYLTGLQRVRRPGPGGREERIDVPAVLAAGAAKTIATGALARAEAGRERRTVACAWQDLARAPGDRVGIVRADGTVEPGQWRVAGWSLEAMVLSLELVRLARAPLPASAGAGRVAGAADLTIGTTIVEAFELPPLDDQPASAPRLAIAAAGTGAGWRTAALLLSTDEGTSWSGLGGAPAPATLGSVTVAPGSGPETLFDLIGAIEVELAHTGVTLAGADDAALDRGVNLAMVGNELLQFGVAQQIGPRRWRLSRLLRGRRGTGDAAGGHAAGERFVMIVADALTVVDLPLALLGGVARVLAAGAGDGAGPASAVAAIAGRSVLPPSPVHLAADFASGGDAVVRWVRRSRAGWRWIDGADAPLAEERESYRVTIASTGGSTRTAIVTSPAITVPAAERSAGAVVTVRQTGSNGDSLPATITLPAA